MLNEVGGLACRRDGNPARVIGLACCAHTVYVSALVNEFSKDGCHIFRRVCSVGAKGTLHAHFVPYYEIFVSPPVIRGEQVNCRLDEIKFRNRVDLVSASVKG